MATPAYHYLSIFDGVTGRALWLGRTKRIASPDQRIVLHAKDRGCTHPGCDMPGYLCEVHHVDDWAQGGPTDIDNLTFACAPHHKLLGQGWRTTKLTNGQTQWTPPPQLPFPATPTTTTTPNDSSTLRKSTSRTSAEVAFVAVHSMAIRPT